MSLEESPPAEPLTAAEFDHAMAALRVPSGVERWGVALSGGPDSVALTHLLARWTADRGVTLNAYIVDHGLRAEAAAEAAAAAAWCAGLGITARVLIWSGPKPRTAILERARRARYGLLLAACKADGVTGLATAHHADDQAETVLMRLVRGSGIDGLRGIPPRRFKEGIFLVRPLLDVAKSRLVATCAAHGHAYAVDPDNAARRFERPRWRAALADLGVDGERTRHTTRRLRRAVEALDLAAAEAFARHGTCHPWGEVELDGAGLMACAEEIRLRAGILALALASGKAPVRLARLSRLEDLILSRLAATGPAAPATISGCRILAGPCRRWRFVREAAAIVPAQPLAELAVGALWDGRFRLDLDGWRGGAPIDVGPAGTGRRRLMGLSGIGDSAAAALPVLRRHGRIVAIPRLRGLPPPSDCDILPMFEAAFAAENKARRGVVSAVGDLM